MCKKIRVRPWWRSYVGVCVCVCVCVYVCVCVGVCVCVLEARVALPLSAFIALSHTL